MKTMIDRALVLEGGGLRGQYTAGVLDAFLKVGLQFPYIIGVSAGSSIGCSYVSGQRGRNLEIIERYRKDPRYLSLRNLIFTGSIFGMDFIFNEVPHRLIPFDFEAYQAYPGRFVTVCTDCDTSEAVYYEKEEDPMTVLRASSSMPYLSRMVPYRGRQLLDGAISDALPLPRAKYEGYEKNVVILTRPRGYRKKEELHPPNWLIYGRFPKLCAALSQRVSRYNEALEFVEAEEAAGRALVIQPRGDLEISRTEKSIEKLRALYYQGIEDGSRFETELAAV